MSKSPDAFRTISEVADWLETPAHVLRFWESKFTQVKPVKRAGGRRYYRPADMQLLGGIKKLLHDDGLTIKGVQKLLREHGVKHVSDLSQVLDEDLIEEAAYEADALPEPAAPATVLSFPARTDTVAPQPETPKPTDAQQVQAEQDTPVDAGADAQGDVSPVHSEPEPAGAAESPLVQETADADVTEQQPDTAVDPKDTPPAPDTGVAAFGGDNLPAFMRRSAATPPDLSEEQLPDQSPADLPAVSLPDHAEEAEPAATQPAAIPTPPVAADQSAPADAARSAVDVPALATIAPELDSFDTAPGLLSRTPGLKRISPALAAEMVPHLTELRALRDRMRR